MSAIFTARQMLPRSDLEVRSIPQQCAPVPMRLLMLGPPVQRPSCIGLQQAARVGHVGTDTSVLCSAAATDRASTPGITSAPANQMPPFHLAFPVHNIDAARDLYGGYVALNGIDVKVQEP